MTDGAIWLDPLSGVENFAGEGDEAAVGSTFLTGSGAEASTGVGFSTGRFGFLVNIELPLYRCHSAVVAASAVSVETIQPANSRKPAAISDRLSGL